MPCSRFQRGTIWVNSGLLVLPCGCPRIHEIWYTTTTWQTTSGTHYRTKKIQSRQPFLFCPVCDPDNLADLIFHSSDKNKTILKTNGMGVFCLSKSFFGLKKFEVNCSKVWWTSGMVRRLVCRPIGCSS